MRYAWASSTPLQYVRVRKAETKALRTALDLTPADLAAAMRLALLTAQRKSEVFGMTWAELDLDGGLVKHLSVARREQARASRAARIKELAILRDRRAVAK